MPRDIRLNDPSKHLDDVEKFFSEGQRGLRKIDYEESFRAKSHEPPFNINRFGTQELSSRLVTRKQILNRRLDFANNAEEFQLFTGLGRFDTGRNNKEMPLYSFEEGRANTKLDFRQTPEYQVIGELWKERYALSPTISPGDRVSNPMPRDANPDPKGFLMATAQQRAEREAEGQMNVAQLLSAPKKEIEEAESKQA